ncbi:MAG: NAD(P)-dependent oxidoreductase [Thermotogae bacterium]|nr:NAD(P)-dependent oxidoreductase [Thermotogota bacterium]
MIAVFGSSGTLGRAIRRLVGEGKFHTREDWDLRTLRGIRRFLHDFLEGSEAVINAAAYTDVDGAEREPVLAFRINAQFPKVLAQVCREANVKLIHLSTDYVFDGEVGYYYEDDPPQPRSVYGKSKLLGEMYVLEEYPEAMVVRTSWIFGEGGRNFFSRLPLKLLAGETVFAHDLQTSSPTYAPFLARILLRMLEEDLPGGIYHITGKLPLTPFDGAILLADELNSTSRIVRSVPEGFMDIRPRSSVLLSSRYAYPMPSFIDSVRDYLATVKSLP